MPAVRDNVPVEVQRTFNAPRLQAAFKSIVCDAGSSSRLRARSLNSAASTTNPRRSLQRLRSNTQSITLVARPVDDLPYKHDVTSHTTPSASTSRTQLESRARQSRTFLLSPSKQGVGALGLTLELKPPKRGEDATSHEQEQEETATDFLPGRSVYTLDPEAAVDVVLDDLWISTPPHRRHVRPRLNVLLNQSILLSILGSGSFGVVVLVQRNRDLRHWAVKIARKDKLATGTTARYEYAVLRAVQHPFIIQTESLFEDDHYVYLWMEPHGIAWDKSSDGSSWALSGLLGDSDLSALRFNPPAFPLLVPTEFDACGQPIVTASAAALGLARFDEHSIQVIASQMVQAVAHIHSCGCAHRDIKLGNFLLDRERVKLLDFGLAIQAKCFHHLPRAGTRTYQPPEFFDPKPTFLPAGEVCAFAADIFALGAAIYQLVTARKGRDHNPDRFSPSELCRPAGWSTEGWMHCRHIVERCLVSDPARRPTAPALLTNPWLNFSVSP